MTVKVKTYYRIFFVKSNSIFILFKMNINKLNNLMTFQNVALKLFRLVFFGS